MNKRLLSMFLALCMIVTMLPVSAMAEEIHTTIGGSGEIISFAPLAETEKAVSLGTSIEDLELPETLTATVRTAVSIGEDAVQDSGSPKTATPTTATEPEWEETTGDIPVTWDWPDYDPNTEGVYVFTPVIEGYTVSAKLPELTVTVGAAIMGRGMVAPLSVTTYNIWVGGVQVTSDNKADVLGAADGEGATVTYDSTTNTLTLNDAEITTPHMVSAANYGIYAPEGLNLKLVGANSINLPNSIYTVYGISSDESNLQISAENNGSLTVTAGNNFGIYSENLTINSGAITTVSSVIFVGESVSISGGTVTSTGGTQGIVGETITVSGGTVTASGSGKALTNSVGSPNFTGMQVTASLNENGTPAVSYNAANLSTYKYIKVEPAPESDDVAQIGSTGYATLQQAVDSAAEGQIIKLVADITITSAIQVNTAHSFTLDLNGHPISCSAAVNTIVKAGEGALTITDSQEDGAIVGNTGAGASTVRVLAGTLIINGGTISQSNINNRVIHNGSSSESQFGTVEIRGGSINGIISNAGNLTITDGTIDGGAGVAIYNYKTALVSGGTITSNSMITISNTADASLTITGGTISNSCTTGSYGAILNMSEVFISGGTIDGSGSGRKGISNYGITSTVTISAPSVGNSIVIKGDAQVIDSFGTFTVPSSGATITGSTNYDGTNAEVYNASNLASYKYIKVEPSSSVSEQFTLAPGGTYYFDLSIEKANIGTVNTALPGTSLHYVPFTYAGTVNAYSLTSAMATTEEYATANKSDRSLFVGNYNVGTSVSWDNLNTADLIFGKTFDTNYKLRSLSAGSSKTGSESYVSDNIGQPNTNEWDQILNKSGSTDNTAGWIKNWSNQYSWGQDTHAETSSYRASRGYNAARRWNFGTESFVSPICGFRPALEVLDPDTLTSDGLKEVTLNLNGGSLKESTANINIICAGDNFTAPSGVGLTAPTDKVFDGWKDTSGTTYTAGDTVPNTVTGLTAQWAGGSVAQIGSTGYPTLQAAVDAAADGATITLLSDITAPNTGNLVATAKSTAFTLDFNGHTITSSGNNAVISYNGTGTLTLDDSKGEGGIEAAAVSTISQSSGAVIINGGVFRSATNSTSTIYVSLGTLTINGGTIIKSSENYRAIWGAGMSVIKICGGTIEAPGSDAVGVFSNSSAIQRIIVDVQSGSATIKGGNSAMTSAPTIASGTQVTASAVYSGLPTTTYSAGSIGSYKYLKFEPDTTSPAITSVYTTTTNGTYTMGDTLAFVVKFNENVNIVGTPHLTLLIGSQTRKANYEGGNGTTSLRFSYTVQAGDVDKDEIQCLSPIMLNGGTIKDAAGNNANLIFSSPIVFTGILVDALPPSITAQPTSQTVNEGVAVPFVVTASSAAPLSYQWQLSTDEGYTFTDIDRATTQEFTIFEAEYAMNGYRYRCVVTNSAGTVYSNPAKLTVNQLVTAPDAPTDVTATAGEGQASVSFTAPASNGGAAITAYTVTSSPGGFTGTGTASPVTVNGLTNGTSYIFTVTATNSAGASAASAPSNGVTPMANQTITFTNPGAQSFGTTPTLIATASSGLAVTFTSNTPGVCTITSDGELTFISAGTASITANQAGNGSYLMAPSVTQTFTVNPVQPGAPTGVTATAGDGQASVSFMAPASNGGAAITSYTVTSSPGDKTATGTTSPITVDGLTNGTSYIFTVTATSSAGNSAASVPSNIVTPNAPTCTISGTIKGSDTGSGISGAVVQLKSGSSNVGSPVFTDTNGAYTISDVSAGTYSIEVSSLHYNNGTISSFTVSESVTGKELTLTSIVIFTPVTDITMTNAASVQVGSDLTLTGIVSPANATNQNIVWSIESANGTGATIVDSTFRATSAGTATVKATVANGSTASSDYTKTFDITVTTTPVVTHTITATTSTGGSISPSGSVTVNSGTSQTFTITPTSNYSIADVKVDGVSQGRIASYTFSNVTANHTISATFSYNGSSGGGSSSDNSSPVIVTPPAPDKPNSPTQGEIKVPGTVDSKGNITVNITDKTVVDAFDKALADAKKNGNEQNGITVILRVDTGSKTGSNVTVNLPKTVQDTIIAKKIVNTIVVVDNPDIRIGMDLTTVQEINKQAKSDVNITATRTDSGKLTGEAKKAIGSRPVFDLAVNYGSGKQVQNFGTGSVSVTIPYTIGANEKAGNVQAVYVDAKGKVHWLTNSVYDSVEQVLRFSTDHFSTYGIGYKQTNTAFTDIAAHWAKEDIEFVVSRGLFSGTSNTTFSPNTAMTRGMFVTALGRLANADVSSYAKSSFTDVKSDAYYMGYIEWASKNSIVNGTGNGKFAPDQSITREQMAVIMQNYAKVIGFTLPKVHVENTFADNAKISAYAKDAVKQMQMAGVISGKSGNIFDPQGTATRAEVSAVLRRFVELAISSDTMQGWTRNDSGQWMYYENGKAVTGKKDIGGTTYTFDQYGVTTDVPKNLRYITYTVQKGDSFWVIARKLGCTMSELERLNNKSRFDLIHPGDVLRVPEK